MPTFRPGQNTTENHINRAFARLLTPTLALTVDSGWLHQNWPVGHMSAFDKTDIGGLKHEAFRDNRRETLVSVSLARASRTLARKEWAPTRPTPFSRASFFDKEFVMSIKTRIAALTLAALVATRSTAVTATSAEAREFHGEHGFHEDHDFHHGWGWRRGSYNDGFSNDSYY
jgi:hypothetical protein